MFPEKEGNWITSAEDQSFYRVTFPSWSEWLSYRTDTSFGWKDYMFITWNARKFDDKYKIQMLFIKKYGVISINEILIQVKESEEAEIREWFSKYP